MTKYALGTADHGIYLVACSVKDTEITVGFEGRKPVLYSFLNPDSIVSKVKRDPYLTGSLFTDLLS